MGLHAPIPKILLILLGAQTRAKKQILAFLLHGEIHDHAVQGDHHLLRQKNVRVTDVVCMDLFLVDVGHLKGLIKIPAVFVVYQPKIPKGRIHGHRFRRGSFGNHGNFGHLCGGGFLARWIHDADDHGGESRKERKYQKGKTDDTALPKPKGVFALFSPQFQQRLFLPGGQIGGHEISLFLHWFSIRKYSTGAKNLSRQGAPKKQ